MDTMVLVAQTCLTAYLAAWLALGVRDNIFQPAMNATFTAEVLQLDRLRETYPDEYAQIEGRRIESPALQRAVFRFIVFAEAVVCTALWMSAVWMALAVIGQADAETARTAALASTLGFTTIWAAFLIAGNHFAYWFCHEWAQNTHFQMLIWGIATMVFLVVG